MIALVVAALAAGSPPHSPPSAAGVTICNAVWIDHARNDRAIPVRIRIPAGSGRVPMVLFSHGLAGSLQSGTMWVDAWAAGGIATINIDHPGSDRAIVAEHKITDAMMPRQLIARVNDVHFVLNEVERLSREGACDLSRIDRSRIGMAGHSYGAITTQAVAGEKFPFPALQPDRRIKAAIAFSPSPPWRGSVKEAFADVRMPFLSITGPRDVAPIQQNVSAADRQLPFEMMPDGDKYLLVLDGADHMAFNGADERGRAADLPNGHVIAAIETITLQFWRRYLIGEQDVPAPIDERGILVEKDRFQRR